MRTPTPGLRRFVNNSQDVAKVQLVIPPGDELEVSDAVAAQLETGPGNFDDPADVPERRPQVVKDADGEIDYDATSDEALAALGLTRPVAEGPPVVEAPVAPVKKPAAKKAPAKPKS